jgi:pimeloyl-ACP methyl ester carboxylesterase
LFFTVTLEAQLSRHLRIPVADTVLDANDTEGEGFPLLLLSGQFATQRAWKGLLRLLGDRYRVVAYDTRARGRSGTSKDYSFASNVDDVSAVLEATGIRRPVLVGWSYGAAIAVRHAALHPGAVSGIVSIDGAFPMAPIDQAERERIRKMWRWMALLMKVAAAFGLSARMSAAQAAESNIELLDVLAELAADFEQIRCPVAFIVGTGKHMGAREEEVQKMRAGIDPIVESRPNVTVFATVPASHTQILAKHPDTIVAAIDALSHRDI